MSTPPMTALGGRMAAEIAEQPGMWRRILDHRGEVGAIARRVAAARPRFVLFAARGTSGHAALYAKYLTEVLLRLPAGFVSPSTVTVYGARPELSGTLLVAVSQSGGSPDLVRTVEEANRGGALTLAVTNDADSPLARAATLHLDVLAGAERAVAATKSYTAQLLTLFLLVDQLAERSGEAALGLPELGDRLLAAAAATMRAQAGRYRFASRMVVTGRGYALATAREAALKLMETSYVAAQAFSGADLMHGPLAMLDAQVPVLAVVPDGAAGSAMAPALRRVRETGADLFIVGGGEASAQMVLPHGVPPALSPLLEILPFQTLALELAIGRGQDPDAPRGLSKVTRTL